MCDTYHDVEPTFDIGTISTRPTLAAIDDIERRSAAKVGGPRLVVERNLVGELEVQPDQNEVAADADLGVRSKYEPVQQGRCVLVWSA